MLTQQKLTATDAITKLVLDKNIHTWEDLISYTQKLPYGRNNNRTDFSLVISEAKGTCSSKHAFLKKIASLNNIPNVVLILGMYKMNHHNTPNIGKVLLENNINYIPEAHCYLKINQKRVDITNANADFSKLKNDILEEIEITPEQVADFKVTYHQNFLKNWIQQNNIPYSFKEIWSIRELCIQNLSNSNCK